MRQTIIIDLDDYCLTSPNFNYILRLKSHFPKFKITLFTVPLDPTIMTARNTMKQYVDWAKMLQEYQDWIEIVPHGFMHNKGEMLVEYQQAKDIIKASENMFTQVKFREKRFLIGHKNKKYKLDIPYKKIFKAPKWEMSDDAYRAARDMGYVIGVDRNQPSPKIENLNTYKYNWSIEEPFPEDYMVVKGHGHMVGMNNDLALCYENLLKMPTDAVFMTISEYLKL
ncbi:hypothetical protein CL633_02390 [bacterium]|nr:hypothetical protein [bacterium]|tara:strand:- start:2400 stop:3074 length:675 start_codon:yes stop_codon:yes gene_type:complete